MTHLIHKHNSNPSFYIRLCEDEHLQNNGAIYRCVCIAHLLLVESRFLFCLNPGLSCYTQQNDFVQFKAGSKRILLYSLRTSLQMLAIVGFRNGAVLPYSDPPNIQNIEPQNPLKQQINKSHSISMKSHENHKIHLNLP
jgi:hypothetical protein